MQRLLDDSLLAIEAGAPVRAEELVDIAPILEREAEDRRRAGAAVSLSVSPAARSAQLIGDALALRRLIANVTDNALTYGREALITADVDGETLILTVDDKGPGISPAEREMVFEPFVRLEDSRNRRTGGAGLGLAIARNAAEAHGGRISLDASPRRRPAPSSRCRCSAHCARANKASAALRRFAVKSVQCAGAYCALRSSQAVRNACSASSSRPFPIMPPIREARDATRLAIAAPQYHSVLALTANEAPHALRTLS